MKQATSVLALNQNISRLALAALASGAAAISFTPILVRLSEVGPVSTAFWRMLLALPALGLLTLRQGKNRPARRGPMRDSSQDYRWLFAAGLFFAADLTAFNWSLEFTTVANASILTNFAPIVVTLGAWLIFNERVTLTFLIGLIIAIGGAIMLVGSGFRFSSQTWLGDILGLLTALFYGSYILVVKQLRGNFSVAKILIWSSGGASLVLLPLALLSGETFLALTLQGWLILLALGLVAQVSGQGLIAYALAHLPAPFSSVTLLIQPTLSIILAWLLLNEAIGPWQAVGGAIVLGGITLARLGSRSG